MRQFASGEKRTAQYLRALMALRELLESQGGDAASCVYAEAVGDSCYQGLVNKGFKRSDGRLCVQRLWGRQCDFKDCAPPAGDHDTLWLKDGKPALYLMQPYGLEWETMRKLVSFCESHGLKADVDAWPSFHYPGQVISILLSRREQTGS